MTKIYNIIKTQIGLCETNEQLNAIYNEMQYDLSKLNMDEYTELLDCFIERREQINNEIPENEIINNNDNYDDDMDTTEYNIMVTFSDMDIAYNNPDNCKFEKMYNIHSGNEKNAMIKLMDIIYNDKPVNISVDKIEIISIF